MKTLSREGTPSLILGICRKLVTILAITAAAVLPPGGAGAATLSLSVTPNVISEASGPGATTGRVTLDTPLTNSVQLFLRGVLDTSKIYLPVTFPLIIPAGSNNITFPIDSVNNGDVDGSKLLTLTIGADLFADTGATLLVTDDDTPTHRTIGGRLVGTISGTNDYYVMENLTIPPGQTLTILPASHLLFGTGKGVLCNGSLMAIGSEGAEIVFTRTPSNANWNGIGVTNSTIKSVLSHAEISYANANGGLSVNSASSANPLMMSNCTIHDCSGNGISVSSWDRSADLPSTIQVMSSRIFANGGSGVVLTSLAKGCNNSSNSATVSGNEIYNNQHSGVLLDASVYYNGCSSTRYTTVDGKIDGNYIHGNAEGITCVAGSAGGASQVRTVASIIQNNLILNNASNGISVIGGTRQSLQPIIVNNTVARNGNAGIYHVSGQVGFTFENNLLILNNYGIQAQTNFGATNVLVTCNDVWGNYIRNWTNYPVVYGASATTNMNGTGADTNLNISVDPMVVSGNDFHLQFGSPAVDAGTVTLAPTTDFEGQNRHGFPDIGYDEMSVVRLLALSPPHEGVFDLRASGGRGTPFSLESTSNFKTWTGVTNATLINSTMSLHVAAPSNAPPMFYRGRVL